MFVAEAALIALREGLEAFLIVGILLGFVMKLGRPDARKWVWIGLGVGIAASLLLGLFVRIFLLDLFENRGGGEAFELVAALVAVGVLTYMVFWMWKHTRGLMVELREKVGLALERNMLWAVAALVFFSVLREGLEVVLFYGALANRYAGFDLAWSGLVGAAISVAIVALILRTTASFNLAKFFAATGILLVFVAAGLLVHSVHAASDLGLLPHGAALWDTSGAIPDERWDGRILHALFGYTAQPTLLQALLYFGYLFGVGIPYLAGLGAFRRRTDKSVRRSAVVAAALLIWLASVGTVWGAASSAGTAAHAEGDDHGPDAVDHAALFANAIAAAQAYEGKIGVLVRDHGEIIEYNATTYEAIKEFVTHIWGYTGFPAEVLEVDQGSYFIDAEHPYDAEPRTGAQLVDAWLEPWNLPAAPVQDRPETGLFCDMRTDEQLYFVPGAGPGMGEPDFFEWCGLSAYRDWLKMENYSPRHDQGMRSWHYLETHLRKHYGDKVVVAFAHGHDTKANANHTLQAAAQWLVKNGATVVLDAYQSSVFSDSMNTCMMAPHAEHALREAGFNGRIVPVGMAGHDPLWGQATADYVEELVAQVPADVPVSVHLAQHGGRPGSSNPCGGEGAVDQYHANLQTQYDLSSRAVQERLAARGNVTVRHVYGQGASLANDGELSPVEALALDEAEGISHAIMVPYEFWGDAVDNLVYLRESLGFTPEEAPYYDANRETRFTHRGIAVHVTSAFFSTETKSEAELSQIARAIESLAVDT